MAFWTKLCFLRFVITTFCDLIIASVMVAFSTDITNGVIVFVIVAFNSRLDCQQRVYCLLDVIVGIVLFKFRQHFAPIRVHYVLYLAELMVSCLEIAIPVGIFWGFYTHYL